MPLCSTITAAKSPVIAPVRSAPPSSASYSGHDRINADEAAHAFYADRHTSRSKKAGHVIPKRIKFCLFWKGARLVPLVPADLVTGQSHPNARISSSPFRRVEDRPILPCSCFFLVFNRSDPLRTLALATPFVCTRTILYIVKPPLFTDKTRLPDA